FLGRTRRRLLGWFGRFAFGLGVGCGRGLLVGCLGRRLLVRPDPVLEHHAAEGGPGAKKDGEEIGLILHEHPSVSGSRSQRSGVRGQRLTADSWLLTPDS